MQIIKLFYENGSSVRATFCVLRPFYGRDDFLDNFGSTRSVTNEPVPVRQRNVRSVKNIAAVRDSVLENPWQSIPRCAHELGIADDNLANFASGLSLHPYKIQLNQELKVNDHGQRRVVVDWALVQLEVDAFLDEWLC